MEITFNNDQKKTYVLGSISFGFLDNQHVFDEFQENHDQNSEVILQTTGKKKLLKLAEKIELKINEISIREDLHSKINGLVSFLKESKKITVKLN